MGMAKALRMLAAEARRAEREEQRRRRELLKQQKQMERMETLQRAAYEVDLYENHIDTLLSVHKECSQVWDWQAVKVIAPPSKPVYLDEGEQFAIPRQTLIGLNFEMIDCSESMNNFVHRIKFSKTKGFSPVEKLKPQDLILRNNPN